MDGAGLPKYDNNGRYGQSNATRLASPVEVSTDLFEAKMQHDDTSESPNYPELPCIVGQIWVHLRTR